MRSTTRRRRRPVWPAITVLLWCVALARPSAQNWKTKAADFDNRYEGLVPVDVGSPDLELASFVGYFEPFEQHVELQVGFYLPSPAPAVVKAQELRDMVYYRMESKPRQWTTAWNRFERWDTRAVIDAQHVSPANIGVVVRLDDQNESGALAPAFVYHTALPRDVGAYRMVFRPGMTLAGAECAVYDARPARVDPVLKQAIPGDLARHEPFYVSLDLRRQPAGALTIVIRGFVKNRSQIVTREYRFFHTPTTGG
jgi:hypothetical protein